MNKKNKNLFSVTINEKQVRAIKVGNQNLAMVSDVFNKVVGHRPYTNLYSIFKAGKGFAKILVSTSPRYVNTWFGNEKGFKLIANWLKEKKTQQEAQKVNEFIAKFWHQQDSTANEGKAKEYHLTLNKLVFNRGNRSLTTSLKVAEVFKKQHRNVLQAINNLTAENSAVKKMFVQSTYVNSRGQEQPMYFMDRDGFTLLAMGFTGQDAMRFKLAYIEAFDEMDAYIRKGQKSLPQTPEERLALTMKVTNRLVPRVNNLEKDVNQLKNEAEIDSDQRYQLWQARKKKALQVCGGKDSNFYREKKGRFVFQELGRDFKAQFVVTRYDHVKKEAFQKALKFIREWYPSYPLRQKIEAANNQTSLDM